MADEKNRPAASFSVKGSGVKVALWRNGDNYNTTVSNSYKAEDGNYKDTDSFSPLDTLVLQGLLSLAAAKAIELQQQGRG
jgi:hypothetical protein